MSFWHPLNAPQLSILATLHVSIFSNHSAVPRTRVSTITIFTKGVKVFGDMLDTPLKPHGE